MIFRISRIVFSQSCISCLILQILYVIVLVHNRVKGYFYHLFRISAQCTRSLLILMPVIKISPIKKKEESWQY